MSLSELCANIVGPKSDNKEFLDKNAMEFITAPWGLAMGCNSDVPALYPTQRFIIKCYYGLELDTSANRDIIVNDQFNEREMYRFNEYEYMMYLFNEGRINRIYEAGRNYPNMVLVCGRRAGKCVVGDTLVLTDKGIFPIVELGEAPKEGFTPCSIGIIQENSRRATAAAYYNGGTKLTYKVTTKSGYTIEGTGLHRVKVMNSEGNIVWRYLDEIDKGDQIAINRKTDLWSSEYVDLIPYHNTIGRKDLSLPDKLDENLANLMGYLVGNGSWNDKLSVSVTVEHPETWEYLKDKYNNFFGGYSVIKDKRTMNSGRLTFHSVSARQLLNDIGWKMGCDRDKKMIPWSILRSPKSVVCAFLRGLFETDGCAEKGGNVTFSSASFRLAHEVQILLLNMGIVSSVKSKWVKNTQKNYANLTIKGVRSKKLFAELIGFDSDKKMSKLLSDIKGIKEGKSDTDSIPHQRVKSRDLIQSLSKWDKEKRGTNTGRLKLRTVLGNVHKNSGENITYEKIKRAIKVAEEIGAGKEEIAHFQYILDTDYYYDSVSEIKCSQKPVYDLTVPDGESFVANGMTNHNTTITSTIICYEVYKLLNKYCPQEYYGIMPEDPIKVTCISTSKETASELFSKIVGHVERSEFFRKYRRKPTQQYVYLHTQRDLDKYGPKGIASINIRVAPCSAKGLRGPGNIVVALDEMAFFFADEKNSNTVSYKDRDDAAIYKAATPSVAKFKKPDGTPDGKIICLSSPGPKSGKFFKEYERSFDEDNEDLVMIQAPTWEIDPSMSSQFLKNSYNANPVSFKSEYGAQFSDRLFGWIDDPDIVRKNVIPGLKIKDRSMLRIPHFMGIDLGLKKDGTAITIGHWMYDMVDGAKIDKLEVDYYAVRYAKDEGKDYFEPEEMVDWIASLTKKFYIARGMFDQYYDMTLEPKLHRLGLKQLEAKHFNDSLNSIVYQMLLSCLLSKTLRIPEGNETFVNGMRSADSELVTELLTLQAQQKSKYIIQVAAPEREGEHDDLSDSLARMVYVAHEYRDKSSTYNIASSSAVGHMKMARMLRKSELGKLSVNRPSSRYMGRMGSGLRYF